MSNKPTQFYNVRKSEGMTTRSGKVINYEANTEFFKNIALMMDTINLINNKFWEFEYGEIPITAIEGPAILQELYTAILSRKQYEALLHGGPKPKQPKHEWVPDFIRKTLLNNILCTHCLCNEIFLSLLNKYKSQLRQIFNKAPAWKPFKIQIIQKLELSKKTIQEANPHNQDTCTKCNYLADRYKHQITSEITPQQRLKNIIDFIDYLKSPTSGEQLAYFKFVSKGIPEHIAKNIIQYIAL